MEKNDTSEEKNRGKKFYVYSSDKRKTPWCGKGVDRQRRSGKGVTTTRHTGLFTIAVLEGRGSGFVFLCIFSFF